MLFKSYSDKTFGNKSSKGLTRTNPTTQPIIGAFVQLYYFFVGVGAVPVRLMLRKNFGERSLTPMAWTISLAIHLVVFVYSFAGVYLMEDKFTRGYYSEYSFQQMILIWLFVNPFTYYLIFVFFKRGIGHFRTIIKMPNHINTKEGSYFRGESRYYSHFIGKKIRTLMGRFVVDKTILRMVVEPRKIFQFSIVIFLISLILDSYFINGNYRLPSFITYFLGATSLIISISALCLFLEELGLLLRLRGAAWDMIDGGKDLELVMEMRDDLISKSGNKEKLLSAPNSSNEETYPIVRIYKG